MDEFWLTCPECGTPAALLCTVHGPLPEDLVLVLQTCHCDYPEEAWPRTEVWDEAQERHEEAPGAC